jgi:hypothetical protein
VKCRALGLALWLAACAGTETGNPSFDGSLGYDAYTSQPKLVALQSAGEDAQLVVESAWLVLGDVRFAPRADGKACDADSASDGPSVPGLGAGDHAATQAPVSPVELSDGRYCGVHLPLQSASELPSAAPPELRGHSLLLLGETRDGRPFRIASALRTELDLRAEADGFELDAERPGVLIGFDVASWLAELDWSQAELDADDRIVVDAEHNALLLAEFEAQFARGVALFRDADGDGLFDAEGSAIAR